jgi:hypothetical protein
MTTASAPTEEVPVATSGAADFRPRAIIAGVGLDVGLPLAAFYGLRALGLGEWAALLAASGVAAARVVWEAVRRRRLNGFATVMLVVFGLGLLLSLVSGDVRFLLLKGSITTGAVALVFLVTSVRGTPLTLAAMQSATPHRAAALQEAYRTDPAVRRGVRICSVVWGAGLLAEAVVRVPLVLLLPVDVAVGASTALFVATVAALIAWNSWYVAGSRRYPESEAEEPGA